MRYHLTPVKTTIVKKNTSNRCRWRCREKGTRWTYWWERTLLQPLWKTVWRFLKKLKIELPYNTAIPLLGYISENTKDTSSKTTCAPMFIATWFTIAKIWKQAECLPLNRWTDKEDVVYTYNGILLTYKKLNITNCSNMDGLRGHYAKRNKSEKGKCCIISVISVI